MKGRRSKYGNKKQVVDGIVYDSKKEYDRFVYLQGLERQGVINNLVYHPVFLLLPKQVKKIEKVVQLKTKEKVIVKDVLVERACNYEGDFLYYKGDRKVVEDVKIGYICKKTGKKKKFLPKEYKLKRKMMLYFHGIEIKEVITPEDEV